MPRSACDFRCHSCTEFSSDSQQQALAREAARTCRALFWLSEATRHACESPENNHQSGFRRPGTTGEPSEVWHVSRSDPPHTRPTESHGRAADRTAPIDVVLALVRVPLDEFPVSDYGDSASLRDSIISVHVACPLRALELKSGLLECLLPSSSIASRNLSSDPHCPTRQFEKSLPKSRRQQRANTRSTRQPAGW